MGAQGDKKDPWEYSLRKYLLLLATLVATVTYTAGFNPPGGVWQDTDEAAGHLAGDPIIRDTSYRRYLVFFYFNATAFASSLVVIVLILILSARHEKRKASLAPLHTLRGFMVLDLLSLLGAYAAGTYRETPVYSLTMAAIAVVYVLVFLMVQACRTKAKDDNVLEKRRKMLMLLATFAASITYLAGLSAPGGFWDHAEGGHGPGEAVLKGGRHHRRLKGFFYFNTTTFISSLLITVQLLDKNLHTAEKLRISLLYLSILSSLLGLTGAYATGSGREIDTTLYGSILVFAVLICTYGALALAILVRRKVATTEQTQDEAKIATPQSDNSDDQQKPGPREKARSLVLLLATLAATITYQAGLDPPGGIWEDDGDGHKAGDPILLTTNPRRYKAFFYCNSVAFVASLLAIILVKLRVFLDYHALEAAMILDLIGLIGAYAAGSCRDVNTSIYAMALAGAVLVYVVIHVVLFTLDHVDSNKRGQNPVEEKKNSEEKNKDSEQGVPSEKDKGDKSQKAIELVEKRRKRMLLFAILAATITYQAGLTPPSGFRLQNDEAGHHAGDPVLLYNYPRRYKTFFYCNSVSFMLSIALIILLVNPNLYRPAIRSNALSICTAVGMFTLVGAYAAGSTQHLKTSFYIFGLVAAVLIFVVVVVIIFVACSKVEPEEPQDSNTATADAQSATTTDPTKDSKGKKLQSKRKYIMLLGILVASVTYQAGLKPPGGMWQSDGMGHSAGNPIMHDNRRRRYLTFFYINSTSFVASIMVIILLVIEQLKEEKWWSLTAMNTTIALDLLGLLVAYAVGSSRSWKTTGYVSALVIPVFFYVVMHVTLACLIRKRKKVYAWISIKLHQGMEKMQRKL